MIYNDVSFIIDYKCYVLLYKINKKFSIIIKIKHNSAFSIYKEGECI